MIFPWLPLISLTFLVVSLVESRLTWGTTEFLFTFGDSYTTDGFNISAGIDSPVPGFVRTFILINITAEY